MTWFKVDDKFHSHRKVAALGEDVGALALWTIAGSWCADHLTDGFVPRYMVPQLVPVSKRRAFSWANSLTNVGLWEVFTQESGDDGWRFHGWNEPGRQPTSAQVIADREANAARQAEFRARRKATRNAVTPPVGNGVSNRTPARPDPVLPTEVLPQRASEREATAGIPVELVPLVDALTAEGFVVTWDLGFVQWDRVRVAVAKSGIPALVQYVRNRDKASKSPAYSARAWVPGWSALPAMDTGARTRPAPPTAIGAPSEAAAAQPLPYHEVMARHERAVGAGIDFGDAFGMPA